MTLKRKRGLQQRPRREEKSNFKFTQIHCSQFFYSIERDAQLLANRIALLKQEEMKTWKKIEETKKRTGEIHNLKKRNEDKIIKVILILSFNMFQKIEDLQINNES